MPRLKLLSRSLFVIAAGICFPASAIAFSNLEILVKDIASIESYYDRFTAKASAADEGGNADPRIMVEHRLRLSAVVDTVTSSNLLSPDQKESGKLVIDLPLGLPREMKLDQKEAGKWQTGIVQTRNDDSHGRVCYEYIRTVMEESERYALRITVRYSADTSGAMIPDSETKKPMAFIGNGQAERISCRLERLEVNPKTE
jgi:hypothetical protein